MKTKVGCQFMLAVLIFAATFAFCESVHADGGLEIYWARGAGALPGDSRGVRRLEADGTTITPVVTGHTTSGVALDIGAGHVYFSKSSAVLRADLDGGNIITVVSGITAASIGIVLDFTPGERRIYWTNTSGGEIRRTVLGAATIAHTAAELVVSGLGDVRDVVLDVANTKIYWTDLVDNEIRRTNMNNLDQVPTDTQLVASAGVLGPRGIALDLTAGIREVYWTDSDVDGGSISRADMDGPSTQTPETLITGLGAGMRDVELDLLHGDLYWSVAVGDGTGFIQRVALSDFSAGTPLLPSAAEDVVTGLTPQYLDLHVFPELPAGSFPMLAFTLSGLILYLRKRIVPST